MFDDQPKSTAAPVEDIFASADKAPAPPASPLAPVMSPTARPQATPAASSPLRPVAPVLAPTLPAGAELMGNDSPTRGRWIIFGIGSLVILGLVGGVWWFLSRTPAAPAPSTTPTPASSPTSETVTPPTSPTSPAPTPADADGDGLSDAEEQQLGTNPLKPDTDDDGLFDGEEVNVYHTNPLKADTDGDGYTDGQEVHNGYNPLGPGKLLELPPQP